MCWDARGNEKKYFWSGAGWKEKVDCLTSNHSYSLGRLMLILMIRSLIFCGKQTEVYACSWFPFALVLCSVQSCALSSVEGSKFRLVIGLDLVRRITVAATKLVSFLTQLIIIIKRICKKNLLVVPLSLFLRESVEHLLLWE